MRLSSAFAPIGQNILREPVAMPVLLTNDNDASMRITAGSD
jgi:hypothetical protein